MPGVVPAGAVPGWSRGKTGAVPGRYRAGGVGAGCGVGGGAGQGMPGAAAGAGPVGMPVPVWGEAGGGPRAEGMRGRYGEDARGGPGAEGMPVLGTTLTDAERDAGDAVPVPVEWGMPVRVPI